MLDPEFVGENLKLIQGAIEGDTESLSELQKKLSDWNTKHLDDVAKSLNLDINTDEDKITDTGNLIIN